MKHSPMHTTIAVFVSILAGLLVPAALAQAPLPTPPPLPETLEGPPSQPALFPPAELDRIVSPIALYPDPLLAQVLAAATFPAEIPEAARWADEHHYLTGMQLTAAIAADRLPWDPSVQALLPFPSVLDMMASTMPWTQELGEAFLAQRDGVMDAVQRMRQKAKQYGYLQSNAQITVSRGPYIEILPVNPDYIVVPYLQSVSRLRTAAARLPRGGRDSLRVWRPPWGLVRAVGMGLDALGVGDAHRDHRQHAVGADLGQSLRIHASVPWPGPAYRTASSRRPSTGPATAGGTRACPAPVTHGRIGFAVLVAIFVL